MEKIDPSSKDPELHKDTIIGRSLKTPKGVLFLFLACFFACGLSARAEVGFSFSLLTQSSAYTLVKSPARGLNAFADQAIFPISAQNRNEQVSFDSLYTSASIRLRVGETNLVEPLSMEYGKYRDMRIAYDLRKAFIDETVKSFKAAAEARSGDGIAIDVPFKIKSKTFRRIFGGDNIGLRVQGTITIDGKFRQQKFDEIQAANQRNSNNDFNIDMTQRFTIAGKIGEKVQVDVNQDSERLFDFENSLKLTYTGDKDEIVQRVEAGNVSLSLGTNLATFSGQNKGLFGIKTEAKVGALKLTGIASLERGQKNKQKPNEGARRASWSENDFLQNVYFWITNQELTNFEVDGDTLSVSNYRENYRLLSNRQHIQAPIQLSEIQVWVEDPGGGSQNGVQTSYGVAVALQNIERLNLPTQEIQSGLNEHQGTFRLLTPTTDYYFDPQLGYIRLRTPLPASSALACAFVTARQDTFGRMSPDSLGNLRLILLNPSGPDDPTGLTWDLMFRHVYSVQTTNLNRENFKLDIVREAAAGADEVGPPGSADTYLTFFEFDKEGPNGTGGPDGYVDDYSAIIDFERGELHFLDLTPFSPSGFIDANTGETRGWDLASLETANPGNVFVDTSLYEKPASQAVTSARVWRFQTEFKGSTSQYDLGPLVLEGSEEVTLNGNRLVRGSDYTIDYLSGQLKILNEAAKAPNALLEIAYESGQVFQLDRKTLLGARAEYELWQDSYIGGMILHLNEKSLDKRVRIGSEPIRNTLYDVNSQLKFRPNFLTTIADRLPLVRTNVASEFVVDGEVAKVFPNPNALSNASTGDVNGLAYIDDFEASRRSVPLGMLRKNWTLSSIPVDPDIDSLRGRFRWWNPRTEEQVRVQDVYPERETNSQVADRLQSLVLEYVPLADSTAGITLEESWGGVVRYLGAGYEDQSRAQFLEFWIQLPANPDPLARLVIDLGVISEDALPNDTMNSEDRPEPDEIASSPRREYGNRVLSREEDTGIDGIGRRDDDVLPDSAYWNGPTRPAVPSLDDWSYSVGSSDYSQINGSENSLSGDESSNIPDSEDLNGNYSLDQANEYFSYNIKLDYSNPYIVGGQNLNRWRLFRIPIEPNENEQNLRRTVGNPSLTNIRFARMYLTGMTDSTRIQIVQNDIVSNEWLPEYVDADSIEFVSVSVINNHENPEYFSPPGVQGEIDPITNLRQREQSLVLNINELRGGQRDTTIHPVIGVPSEFFVVKNLFQQLNMIEYKRLKMFAHGGGVDEALFEDEQYQLILRLGASYSNTNVNYYDIVKTMYKGWDPRNHIDIAMNDLSILSAWRLDSTRADYNDSIATVFGHFAVVLDSVLYPADSLVINGRPSLQNIGFIALGVRAMKRYNNSDDEIWVDEMRVSDIYKDPGTAGEFSTSLKIADLLTATGSYTKRDADFHNVNTRTGDQRTSETIRGSLSMQLQKFGLEPYGFSLPFSVNRTESEEIPKYVPNTDARVNQDHPDSTVITKQIITSYTASYAKSGNSRNPLLRWTAEKLRLTWDHSDTKRKDYLTLKQEQKSTNARADYTFPTAHGRGVAPLWFLNGVPLLTQLGNPRIFLKPKQLSGSIAARRTDSFRETRAGQKTPSEDFGATGSGNIGWDITETLGTGLSQTYGWTQVENVLFDTDGDSTADSSVSRAKPWKELANLHRRDLNAEAWSWTNVYQPQLASWLTPTFNYSSTYNWAKNSRGNSGQINSISQNQTVSNNNNIGGDISLDMKRIFGSGADDRSRGREQSRVQPRRPVLRDPSATSDSTETDSTETAPVRSPRLSPLQIMAKALIPFQKAVMVLDPVQVSYDQTASHSQNGLKQQGSLRYRLGLTQDPGFDVNDTTGTDGQNRVASNTAKTLSKDYSARSGIRLSRDIRTTFVWTLRNVESISTTSTGSVEQTYFWLGNDQGIATQLPFADVTVDWTGLERLPFISKAARTVSLNSGLTNRYKEDWLQRSSNVATRTYNRQFSPLIGINISWLNSLDSQFRINAANTFTESVTQQNKARTASSGANATVSYTMRTGFRLPILWFGAMRLENSTTFSMNVDYSTSRREATQTAGSNWSTQADEISWAFRPSMNYTFSSTVTGGAHLEYSKNQNKITDKGSRLFEFGINVSIAIRG